ncbi:long-chain fatty acid--CoA ligase, partial [Corallococcus exiguus]|uniref:AMP-binding enzyme n=1 Tax=Corallococcus exiguus TaxID=83462 RepID=UPI001F8C902F|nr:long-chain fatty acid--CoA ligase [Corallococcus exiguus]
PGAPTDAQSLVDWCRERLAAFKKPRRVVFTDALPRNALGKVQKHILKERLAGAQATSTAT